MKRWGEKIHWGRDPWESSYSNHLRHKPYRTFDASKGEPWRTRPEIERKYSRYTGDRLGWMHERNNNMHFVDSDDDRERKRRVAGHVRSWMLSPFVVVDTETTGLEDESEIVSIGIVSHRGEVLLDTLIRPTMPIPKEATSIHGITDDMVADAPTFEDVYPLIRSVMQAKRWAGYNLDFDTGKLSYQVRLRGLEPISPAMGWHSTEMPHRTYEGFSEDTLDVMDWYATWWGDWHDYFGNYRWQKLADARQRHALHNGRDHGALDDSITTLRLIEFLGGYDG